MWFHHPSTRQSPAVEQVVIQPEGSRQALKPIGKWRFEYDRLNVGDDASDDKELSQTKSQTNSSP